MRKIVTREAPLRRDSSKLEEMIMNLTREIENLKSEKTARASTKPVSKKKVGWGHLKKIEVPGTNYKYFEVDKELKIGIADANSDRAFKTAKGKRARVFIVNKNFPQAPVLGAVEVQAGLWDIRVWHYNGGVRTPWSVGNNLVGYWEE